MGFDVYGRNAKTKTGEYFRNNVWWWRPLWEFCVFVAPDIINKDLAVKGTFNDGAGLGQRGALNLAKRLKDKLADGFADNYKKERDAYLLGLPDEPCSICEGTGKRQPAPEVGAGDVTCNGCEGKGKKRPWSSHYPFEVENVKAFIAFLEDSGGFHIN
jgi:hypothetical protein